MLTSAFLALHLIGLALGIGGATIGDLLILQSLRRRVPVAGDLLGDLSMVIWLGLAVLTVSGIVLFAQSPATYVHNAGFVAKMVMVAALMLNGALLHRYVRAFRLSRWTLLAGAVSSVSWYGSLLVAVFKNRVALPLWTYLSVYALAVVLVWGAYVMLLARLTATRLPACDGPESAPGAEGRTSPFVRPSLPVES